jgi:hypothetical protein
MEHIKLIKVLLFIFLSLFFLVMVDSGVTIMVKLLKETEYHNELLKEQNNILQKISEKL